MMANTEKLLAPKAAATGKLTILKPKTTSTQKESTKAKKEPSSKTINNKKK
jgi:hypothetical protein